MDTRKQAYEAAFEAHTGIISPFRDAPPESGWGRAARMAAYDEWKKAHRDQIDAAINVILSRPGAKK